MKTEMTKLITLLLNSDIPFDLTTDSEGNQHNQVWYPSRDNAVCDVICHKYSYGGNDGLLEMMGLLTDEEGEDDDVIGWLTADEVYRRISADYKGE